jgi:hypothetical protein
MIKVAVRFSLLAAITGVTLLALATNSFAQERSVKSSLCIPCLFGIELDAFDKSQRQAQGAARRRELETLRLGTVKRLSNETAGAFLQRVLPASYPAAYGNKNQVVEYSWRPSPFGQQLFFSVLCNGGDKWDIENDGGSDFFILDPFQPDTYSVQLVRLETMGDLTTVASVFFADVELDGRKELMILTKTSLRESTVDEQGERMFFHADHYATSIFRYKITSGRPQYQEDLTPRPYLNDLATAAAVRKALSYHRQSPKRTKR